MCESWTTVNVCFDCRVGFERRTRSTPPPQKCPQCGGALVRMGGITSNFKIPKKRNIKQWQKVKRLYDAGVRFGPRGCCSRGDRTDAPLPQYLWQVDEFLRTDERLQKRKSTGEKLLEKINQASGGK